MSVSPQWGFSRSGIKLVAEVVGQVLLAAAATAGVLAIAGCARVPDSSGMVFDPPKVASANLKKSPTMRAANMAPPEGTLLDPPAANLESGDFVNPAPPVRRPPAPSPSGGAVSAFERQRARQEADSLMNEATVPSPAAAIRGSIAMRGAEKAVAPLIDTLAAIDIAQRAIVDNLRNLETPGFKATRTACGDGRDVTSQVDMTQGELQQTRRALDIGIQGEGMLLVRVYTPEHRAGLVGYTRNGRLYVAKDGFLVVGQGDGYRLVPALQIPVGTTEIKIDQDGTITAFQPGSEKQTPQTVARLSLARFTDPSALQPLGGGVYAETPASGAAVETPATERGTGSILQGYLEATNVDLVKERMRLRFLQGWRATVLSALDGTGSPEQQRP